MPIPVTCDCGRKIRVPDELAGRRIKCPECGEPQTVPTARAAASATKERAAPAEDSALVKFRCSCGQQLQAKAAYAGRSVRCPECDDAVRIPGNRAEEKAAPVAKRRPADDDDDDAPTERRSRVQSEKPALRSRPDRSRDDDDRDDEDDDDDRPRRSPARRTKGKKKRGMPVWPFIAAAAGLLLLIGAGVGLYFLLGSGGAEKDLLPADAVAFVSMRPSELATSPFFKQLSDRLPPNLRNFGQNNPDTIKIEDLDRITVVFTDPKDPETFYVVITTKRWIDKTKEIASSLNNAREVTVEGKSYNVGTPREAGLGDAFGAGGPKQPLAVYFQSSKCVVYGSEKGVKSAIAKAVKPVTVGPMAAAASRISSSTDHVFIAFQIPPNARANMQNDVGNAPQMKEFMALSEFQTGVITFNAANTLDFTLAVDFTDDAKAAAAKDAADKGIAKLKTLVGNAGLFGAAFLPKGTESALTLASNALKTLAPTVQGKTLSMSLKLDSNEVMQLVIAGQAAAQQAMAPPIAGRPGGMPPVGPGGPAGAPAGGPGRPGAPGAPGKNRPGATPKR